MINNVVNLEEYSSKLPEPMLRAKDLAKIFINTTHSTFDNWWRKGLINRYKINGGVYYKVSEVENLIKNSMEYREVK